MRERERERERQRECVIEIDHYTSKLAPDNSKKGLAAFEKQWGECCEKAWNDEGKLSYCMLLYCTECTILHNNNSMPSCVPFCSIYLYIKVVSILN